MSLAFLPNRSSARSAWGAVAHSVIDETGLLHWKYYEQKMPLTRALTLAQMGLRPTPQDEALPQKSIATCWHVNDDKAILLVRQEAFRSLCSKMLADLPATNQ